MATSNPMNDPKTAMADEAAIQDLPESKDSRALTPDEETNVRGGDSRVSNELENAAVSTTALAPAAAANVVNSSRSNVKGN